MARSHNRSIQNEKNRKCAIFRWLYDVSLFFIHDSIVFYFLRFHFFFTYVSSDSLAYSRLTHLTHPKANVCKAKYGHRSDWMKAWSEMEYGLQKLVQKQISNPTNAYQKCEKERMLDSKVKKDYKQSSPITTVKRRSPRLMKNAEPQAPTTITKRRSSRIKQQKKQWNEFSRYRRRFRNLVI